MRLCNDVKENEKQPSSLHTPVVFYTNRVTAMYNNQKVKF